MKTYSFCVLFFSFFVSLVAQSPQDSLATIQQLKEVILSSARIDLPLKESSRTIQIITSEQLRNSGVLTTAEALQYVSGIDIRQRGVSGMQADLYIRGGSFDQTLLLIDGIKLEDAQTGHHTLNFLPPIEIIERIEVLKGPAARIFGQNAFTGALNIVTKKEGIKGGKVTVRSGSFGQLHGEVSLQNSSKSGNYFAHYTRNTSEGYRFNTDFKNHTVFFKLGLFNQKKLPVEVLTSFSGREFGANGFYASPEAKDQYEETQASLIALQSKIQKGNWVLKPRVYWRRGQDHYVYIRNQPEIYENWHITHKAGAAFDANFSSFLGTTGMGIDISRVSIASNNLGNRSRQLATLFIEQRLSFWSQTIDITPGIALNTYTDFGTFAYPGMDFGLVLSTEWRLYGNIGYTYRIPTYTDLYYADRTTIGNENLKPEEAFSKELGFRFSGEDFQLFAAYFDRRAENLIDYVKTTEQALWEATNIQALMTSGFEVESSFAFEIGEQLQSIRVGYTHLNDDIERNNFGFSRYSINSLKHHFTMNVNSKISDRMGAFIGIKYAARDGFEAYTVWDASFNWQLKSFVLTATMNNLLNRIYSETNLVPMPGRNGLVSLSYKF